MKVNKILCLFFLILANLTCFSQVYISGKIKNSIGKESFFYYMPIEGFNNIYYEQVQIHFLKNDSFSVEIPTNYPCFINLSLPEGNGVLRLFTEPNDSIRVLAIFKDSAGTKKIDTLRFSGSNASGHSTYTKYKSLYNQAFLFKKLFPKKKLYTIQEYLNNLFTTFDTLGMKFDELLKDKRVSLNFAAHTKMDIISSSLADLLTFFPTLAKTNVPRNNLPVYLFEGYLANKDLYTKDNLDSIKIAIYEKYNPLDSAILTSGLGLLYSKQYCKDVYNGLVKSTLIYDTLFSKLPEEYKILGYLNGKFLEYRWANTLHWGSLVDDDKSTLISNISNFENYFPNSALLPYLKARYAEALSSIDTTSVSMGDLVFIKGKYHSLKSLITSNFKRKYVFVDLWASWCSPCIQEFMYKNQLEEYLRNKKIDLLYLSIDKDSDKTKWSEIAKSKKLYGFHFLASKEILENIKKLIYRNKTIEIPRYFLINPLGEVILSDLHRPSEFNLLKKEMDNITF